MKTRRIIFSTLLIFSALAVPADTVMVSLHDSQESRFIEIAGKDLAAAVEDGVLEVFFDYGHIVFTFGLPENTEEPPFRSESIVVRVAKSGGASLLLELELSDPAGDLLVPSRIGYRYSDIVKRTVISKGEVLINDVDDGEITDTRELCIAFGRAVARRALQT